MPGPLPDLGGWGRLSGLSCSLLLLLVVGGMLPLLGLAPLLLLLLVLPLPALPPVLSSAVHASRSLRHRPCRAAAVPGCRQHPPCWRAGLRLSRGLWGAPPSRAGPRTYLLLGAQSPGSAIPGLYEVSMCPGRG